VFYGKRRFHDSERHKPNWKNSVAARMRKLMMKQRLRSRWYIYRCSPIGRGSPAMYAVKDATRA
jgi:hypothetical protein